MKAEEFLKSCLSGCGESNTILDWREQIGAVLLLLISHSLPFLNKFWKFLAPSLWSAFCFLGTHASHGDRATWLGRYGCGPEVRSTESSSFFHLWCPGSPWANPLNDLGFLSHPWLSTGLSLCYEQGEGRGDKAVSQAQAQLGKSTSGKKLPCLLKCNFL